MKISKLAIVATIVASTLLTSACGNRVNIKENYDQSEIKKVCVVTRYQDTGRRETLALEKFIQNSFDKLSIPTQQVQTVEDARDSDCSHYFLYSAKFKHTFTKKSSYKIYQVNHNSTKFFPLANIGIKQKIYFDGSNGAQDIIDKVVTSLVTGQVNEDL